MKEIKEICEYRLPCGRCNKFNISCDLSYADFKLMSEIYKIETASKTLKEETLKEECEHEWELNDSTYDEISMSKINRYICSKCGETKTLSMGL